MALKRNNGTTDIELGKFFRNNGTNDVQIGKMYRGDGTADSLIYSADLELLDTSKKLLDHVWGIRRFTGETECQYSMSANGGLWIYAKQSYTWVYSKYIDFSQYSSLEFNVTGFSYTNSGDHFLLGITTGWNETWATAFYQATAPASPNGYHKIDISNFNGGGYICAAVKVGGNSVVQAWLNKIILKC